MAQYYKNYGFSYTIAKYHDLAALMHAETDPERQQWAYFIDNFL